MDALLGDLGVGLPDREKQGADNANDSEFDLGDDHPLSARRELRQWLKRGLIVERGGKILATDAFQRSLKFLESLEDQTMTSTASRLAR
jgi:hypothetical protein